MFFEGSHESLDFCMPMSKEASLCIESLKLFKIAV